MSPSLHSPERAYSVEQAKSQAWLSDVRSRLQAAATANNFAEYFSNLGPGEENRWGSVAQQHQGVIDERTERFLSTLEGMNWNEHMQHLLAAKQDERTQVEQQTGQDTVIEQFAALRAQLDTPDFYNS